MNIHIAKFDPMLLAGLVLVGGLLFSFFGSPSIEETKQSILLDEVSMVSMDVTQESLIARPAF